MESLKRLIRQLKEGIARVVDASYGQEGRRKSSRHILWLNQEENDARSHAPSVGSICILKARQDLAAVHRVDTSLPVGQNRFVHVGTLSFPLKDARDET